MKNKRIIVTVLLLISLEVSGQTAKPQSEVKSQQYAMHMVKFGETLTKIAKMYGVTVASILNVNPSLTDNSLFPEQIIRIPVTGNKKVLTSSYTGNNEPIPKVRDKDGLIPKTAKYHLVEKGETMYSVSKKYGISIEQIQKWNGIKDLNIKTGSPLIVSDPESKNSKVIINDIQAPAVKVPPQKLPEIQKPKDDPLNPAEDMKQADENESEKPDIQASFNESQKELSKLFKEKAVSGNIQSVRGTGAPMTTTLGVMESVYFAMHKTLPVGTIIKIKNLVNSKIVYAKVIGKLPETDENKHVVVRYSLGVKKDLMLQNGKCYVQIEYTN